MKKNATRLILAINLLFVAFVVPANPAFASYVNGRPCNKIGISASGSGGIALICTSVHGKKIWVIRKEISNQRSNISKNFSQLATIAKEHLDGINSLKSKYQEFVINGTNEVATASNSCYNIKSAYAVAQFHGQNMADNLQTAVGLYNAQVNWDAANPNFINNQSNLARAVNNVQIAQTKLSNFDAYMTEASGYLDECNSTLNTNQINNTIFSDLGASLDTLFSNAAISAQSGDLTSTDSYISKIEAAFAQLQNIYEKSQEIASSCDDFSYKAMPVIQAASSL